MSESPRPCGLHRSERILRREEFTRVYDTGARIRGQFATVFVLRNGLDRARLGIAATKKLGGAVIRNRAKRVVRDVFRRNKLASGHDIVVVPHRRLLDARQGYFEAEFRHILERRLRR